MNNEPGTSGAYPVGIGQERNLIPSNVKRSVTKMWARNQSEFAEIHFQWVVEKFSLKSQQCGEPLLSPQFSSVNDKTVNWNLLLFPNGANLNKDCVAVYLAKVHVEEEDFPVSAQFEIILLNHQQQVVKSYCFPLHKLDGVNQDWGMALMKRKDLSEDEALLGRKDELHIHCKLIYEMAEIIATGNNSLFGSDNQSYPRDKAANLSTSFQSLFSEAMPFSDVVLQVNGTNFTAHKFVLAARSTVFAAMFQSEGFTENKTNIVKIEDFEPPVVKEMLRFIYTDRVEKMDAMAKELLIAADKYLVDNLKAECQWALQRKLTVQNCCELLAFADSYLSPKPKDYAMEFVLSHSLEVAKSSSWIEMKQTHPHLGFEVSEALMSSYSDDLSHYDTFK